MLIQTLMTNTFYRVTDYVHVLMIAARSVEFSYQSPLTPLF